MNCRRLLIIGVFVLGLCLVASLLGLAAYFLRGPRTVAGPVVAILSPHPGEQVNVGEVVAVHSTSRDEAHQVVKVELWVDGTLIQVDTSPEGASSLSIVQGWQPLSPGFHTLLVRAFNGAGIHGQATIGVESVGAPEEVAEERPSVPEDFPTIEEIMQGAPIPPESEVLPPPGGFPSNEEGAADEEGDARDEFISFPHPDFGPLWEGARDPLVSAIIPGLLDLMLRWQAPMPPTMVEFAALDFEVQEDYEEIYCYARLADGHAEKVPEDGSFDPAGGRHWDIADHLGGQNSRVVGVPLDQPLKVFVKCYGWSAEAWKLLGELDVAHPREDWHGHIIRASGMGGEGFDLDYTISVATSPTAIPAPFNLQHVQVLGTNYLDWIWDGDQEQIHGFRIYQNDRLLESVRAGDRLYRLSPLSTVPPCGEQFEYHVKAYQGEFGPEGLESPPSNPVHFEGSPCGGEDRIATLEVSERRCSGAAQELKVKYEYNSEHGAASMGVLAYKEGSLVSSIHYNATRIEQFESSSLDTAHVWLEYFGSDTVTTDEIVVFMYDSERGPFYVERRSLNLTWPAPQPDLSITYADIDAAGGLVSVRIQNVGCAPVDEPFTLRLASRDVGTGGTSTVAEIDTYLNPQETYVWEAEFDPVWAGGFTAHVDTQNRIAESNEDNNWYEKGPITLKGIQFYAVRIHDTIEGAGEDRHQGEFRFSFAANEVGRRSGEWVLTYGFHPLGQGVILSPELDWDEDLIIMVGGSEFDDLSNPDGVGLIWYVHSHDISVWDSWKRGGEFDDITETGCCQFFWRLILE